MDFNNLEDFYNNLQMHVGEILKDEADKIKEIIIDYTVRVIYSSYS